MIRRSGLGIAAGLAAVLAVSALSPASRAAPPTLGGDLMLSDFGSFFVGGKLVHTDHPASPATGLLQPGDISVGQMYVQYLVPARIEGPPVVFVHGYNHTGATFETTPDGREGWATYFARKGHPVYVIDQPGRGRSGFDPTPINRAKTTGSTADLPSVPLYAVQYAWVNFRFGAVYPLPFPGLDFPVAALGEYAKQLVPSAESTFPGDATFAEDDLALLLDRIGPAVVVAHSQASGIALAATRQRPGRVAGFVSVEGDCTPITAKSADTGPVFAPIPMLAVFGDNSTGAAGFNGDARRTGCVTAMKALDDAGGHGTFQLLAELGLKGHSHMMMMDRGNLEVADVILGWMAKADVSDRLAALAATPGR